MKAPFLHTLPPTPDEGSLRGMVRFAAVLALCSLLLWAAAVWPGLLSAGGRPWAALAGALITLELLRRLLQLAQALRASLQASNQARERLAQIVDELPAGILLFDAQDRIELANRDFREVYGALHADLQRGTSFEALLRLAVERDQVPEARGREEEWIAQRLAAHRNPAGPLLRQLPGGRWRRIVEQRLPDGSLLSHSIDITELVEREQALQFLNSQLDTLNGELAELSATDALTSLANRREFDRRLAEEFARAQRHQLPMALVLLDVDHFKAYNDAYGHPAGDACLRLVANLLREVARRPSDLAARWGGEEFALLLPHDDGERALALAERLLARLAQVAMPHGRSNVAAHVTVSAGVAALTEHTHWPDPAAMLAAADAALFSAKRAGRGRAALAPA